MLLVQCRSLDQGVIKREFVHAMIHKNLPSAYHDKGLASFNNKDSVKAHTFNYPHGVVLDEGDSFTIEVRGIAEVEDKLYRSLQNNKDIQLGQVSASITNIVPVPAPLSMVFHTVSPIIVRVSNKGEISKKINNTFLTPEDDKELWIERVTQNLVTRAALIYGESVLPEPPKISIRNYRVQFPKINVKGAPLTLKGTHGQIRITGNPFWNDFAFRVGLGERGTYGFGLLKGVR